MGVIDTQKRKIIIAITIIIKRKANLWTFGDGVRGVTEVENQDIMILLSHLQTTTIWTLKSEPM